MVNSNHDPLHTVVRFCNGDDDCVETMVIDEGLGWIQVERKKWILVKKWEKWKEVVNFSIEITYICMVNI